MDQQWLKRIPNNIGWYISGFADGEGSFNVSLKRDPEYIAKWHIEPSFNISQRDISVLALCKRYFGVGTIRQRRDGVYYYEVRNCRALQERIIPFFERYQLLSATKKRNFRIFRAIVIHMSSGSHLQSDGLQAILKLRERLNEGRGRKRKYSLNDYLDSQTKSSETIRQTPIIGDDIVRSHG